MPNKEAIIDNIESYTARQLVDFIKRGYVTYDELLEGSQGYWPSAVRLEVERLLVDNEEPDWENASQSRDIDRIKAFLANYPESVHRDRAREILFELEEIGSNDQPEIPEVPADDFGGEISADAAIAAEWAMVDKDDIDSLRSFRDSFPDSVYAKQARKLITLKLKELGGVTGGDFSLESLVKRLNEIHTDNTVNDPSAVMAQTVKEYLKPGRLSRADLLQGLADDHNLLKSSVVKILVNDGELDPLELTGIGIDPRFIDRLQKDMSNLGFPPARKIESIQRPSTEIYFWGIPSSGKTCSIGMILKAASSGRVALSMREDNSCQGYGYMNRLREVFSVDKGEVGQLPLGTGVFDFYEMGFDLEDREGRIHPVTMVDLAGELIRIMYKNDADEKLSNQQLETLDTLTSILVNKRSNNRKIHVFVIEYGGEKRLYEGLSQEAYLRGAFNYLERTRIFDRDTDAIFLMFTMTDRIKEPKSEWVRVLEEYTSNYYLDFYQGLKRICREKEINSGKVIRIPFTLGEVCFKDYFMPEFGAANHFVKEILSRTVGLKPSKVNRLRQGLSN